jgi:mannan endo-1,4-beta-mannosidase
MSGISGITPPRSTWANGIGQALDMAIPGHSTGSTPLDFLRGISGSQTVAGQHNREPNSEPALWTNWIYDTTGKFPGLWSGDFLYEQDDIDSRGTMIDEAKSQWEQGALINLMYHAAPPDLGSRAPGTRVSLTTRSRTTSGTI